MMDFDFIDGIGWRDVILVLAVMAGVYLVLLVMRLLQVAGKRRDGKKQESKFRLSGWQPGASDAAPASPAQPQPQPKPDPEAPEQHEFARELTKSNIEVELERLRRESEFQRDELVRLAEEVSQLKASRNVSPLYNEAMALAQQGMSAAGIAGRCGISIGEAELVASLARSGTAFEHHEQGEDRDERNTGS